MNDQNTSLYWRKLLELDRTVAPQLLAEYKTWHRFLRPFFYKLLTPALRYYCRIRVSGLENLPQKPPYIIAANHASLMDYATLAWAMGQRREELFPVTTKIFYDNPLARFWIKVAANAVRIDAIDDFFPALRVAAKILKLGQAVYINPEGMCSTDGELLPFRPGVGVLAVETRIPLVPVYLAGTWKALPRGSIFPRPFPVSVTFGQPIAMQSFVKKEKNHQAYDVYKEVALELRTRIEELSRLPY